MKCSYLVRCPGSMYLFWSGVKKFLEEETVKKISMYDEATPEPIEWQASAADGGTVTRRAHLPRVIFMR